MKLAKATPEEVEALLNLMRVLNTTEDNGFPCNPDGTWDAGEDMEHFEVDSKEHLRKFYDRVMGCFKDHPGGLCRTVGGYHLAMTNDVFDPNADTYEWHPDLVPAVEARLARKSGEGKSITKQNGPVPAGAHKQALSS